MSDDHAQLVAELRVLVDTVLDRVEPVLRRVAEPAGSGEHAAADTDCVGDFGHESGQTASGCSWCPVCAAAALVRGEPHDLVTLVAGQLSALIALLRDLLDEYWPRTPVGPYPDGPGTPAGTDGRNGNREPAPAFVPISVTIKN